MRHLSAARRLGVIYRPTDTHSRKSDNRLICQIQQSPRVTSESLSLVLSLGGVAANGGTPRAPTSIGRGHGASGRGALPDEARRLTSLPCDELRHGHSSRYVAACGLCRDRRGRPPKHCELRAYATRAPGPKRRIGYWADNINCRRRSRRMVGRWPRRDPGRAPSRPA